MLLQGCMQGLTDYDWLKQWTDLAKRFAFEHNPALQPRAVIVYGCISKQVSDSEIKQLLRIMVKALESYTDLTLIEAIIMCLTRLQPMLRRESPIHRSGIAHAQARVAHTQVRRRPLSRPCWIYYQRLQLRSRPFVR